MTLYSILVGALVGGVCAIVMDFGERSNFQKFCEGAIFGACVACVPYGIGLAVREVMP